MSHSSADRDAEELARLGYAQQLLRDMGGFESFAVSFSIISILTGAVTLYGHGLRFGGPLVMSAGWTLVTVMTLAVAASLAELASAYPTAGALYHWSARLGGPGIGFLTAWLNTIGQVAVTAAVDYGLAEFLVEAGHFSRAHLWALYAVLLAVHGALNHIGVRVVAIANWLSAWYHVAVVALVVVTLALFAPLRPTPFLFERWTSEPHSYAYGFLVGLLQAQWTFTGYDASAHVSEETHDPRKNAPWGIFLSVAVSGVVGLLLLALVTRAISDLPAAAAAPFPFIAIVRGALPGFLGNLLVWLVIGAMWFCGLSSVTSNSRMLFAFARDGGLPGSEFVAAVSPRFRTPHIAVWASVVAAFSIALWTRIYEAMVALSTIALYASYALPILLGVLARRRGRFGATGPWHLGRFSTVVNCVALGWVAIISVLFVLPPNQLAGYTFAGCLALLGIYWFAFQRARFHGPEFAAPRMEAQP